MMRLFIEGRQVDLSENEVLQVTREIADIREPAQRSSDWSRTFRIPGTSANNKLFGHIFDVNQEQLNNGTQFAPDFNPNKKAAALVTVDEVEQVRGFVRLLNISVTRKGQIEYEVSVHGEVADLFNRIGSSRLSELDFSTLNHQLSKTAIKDSWAHTCDSGKYVYPMIYRGQRNLIDIVWSVDEFRPAIFAKNVVDKIFTAAGYSYTSDSFFNTDFFKKLIIPFPGYPQIDEATATGRAVRARRSAGVNINKGQPIIFNDDSSAGYYDNGGNWDTASGKYTSPVGGARYSVQNELDIAITGLSSATYPTIEALFGVYVDGRFIEGFSSGPMTNNPVTGAEATVTCYIVEVDANLNQQIDVRLIDVFKFNTTSKSTVIASGYTVNLKVDSIIEVNAVQQTYGKGETVNFQSFFVAGQWQQREFLQDLMKLFNLYIEPTGQTKQIYINPRDTFYRNSVVHDLSAKIDYSQPLEIMPMGELDANPYKFTYSTGNDIDSKEYEAAVGEAYGTARVYIDNDFIKNEKEIKTIFASTPYLSNAGGRIRVASIQTEDQTTGQLRLLYWSGKITDEQWILCDAESILEYTNGEIITGGYPHAGHLDNPFTPTLDLSFGMPYYVNLPGGVTYTNNNLINQYWRKYLQEITDKNSKLVRARVYITPADWLKWSFRDLFYFENQYFRLNKINDYQVGEATVTECEFLKIKAGVAFVAQTAKAGGGYDQTDNNNDRFPNLTTRPWGKKKRFAWTTTGGSSGINDNPVFDLTQGINNITSSDIGTPSGEYKIKMVWDTGNWNVKLESD